MMAARPSQNYKMLQQRLVEALGPHPNWNEIHRLQRLLIKEFERAFNVEVSNKFAGSRKRQP
jgi:hypothetical protein